VGGAAFVRGSSGEVELPGLHVAVRVVRGVRAGPRVAFVAGLRGDEVSAIAAVRELLSRLEPARLAGDVLAVPVANVPGLLDPRSPARRRLDRSFPGDARGAPTSRHAHAIFHEVVRKADLVVVLSASSAGRVVLPHVRADLDAPGTLPLATAFGASVVVHDPGRKGSLVRAARETGRPAIEIDVGAGSQLARDAILGAVSSILTLLRSYDMLSGPQPRRPRPTLVRTAIKLRAPSSGVTDLAVTPGRFVKEGEPVATVAPPHGSEAQVVTAPSGGLVLATAARALATEGRTLVWLGTGVRRPPPPSARGTSPRTTIGWSEWVALPDLGVPRLKAKIDTGARTCALHVTALRRVGEDSRGRPVVEIEVPTGSRTKGARCVTARASVVEIVTVRDSGGKPTRRPVIETTLEIGPVHRRVRVTLTDRGEMLFPMLVGRTGLGGDFLVDVGARYLLGKR
jgi:predicted deacylase